MSSQERVASVSSQASEQETYLQSVASLIAHQFALGNQAILYKDLGNSIWANALQPKLKDLAASAQAQADASHKQSLASIDAAINQQIQINEKLIKHQNTIEEDKAYQKHLEEKLKTIEAKLNSTNSVGDFAEQWKQEFDRLKRSLSIVKTNIEDDEGTHLKNLKEEQEKLIKTELEKLYLNQKRIDEQQLFLDKISDHLINPYLKKLTEIKAKVATEDPITKEIAFAVSEARRKLEKEVGLDVELTPQMQYRLELIKKDAENRWINSHPKVVGMEACIKSVKKTINQALQAYNKTPEGRENPFLSRLVAQSRPVGEFFRSFCSETFNDATDFAMKLQESNKTLFAHYHALEEEKKTTFFSVFQGEKKYQEYLNCLSTDLLEAEFNESTNNRKAFRLLLALDQDQLRKNSPNLAAEEIKKQAIISFLSKAYRDTERGSSKDYRVLNFQQEILNRVKNKTEKKVSLILRVIISVLVGFTEGLVAADGLFGFVKDIPGIGAAAANTMKVLTLISGMLVNIFTLFSDARDPIKQILRNTLLGEPRDRLTAAKKGWAIALIASTVGYGFILGGLFTGIALLGAGFPLGAAVVLGALAFVALTALFLNVAIKFIKNGGLEKIANAFNFPRIWREFSAKNKEMSMPGKIATFIIFKIIVEKILGLFLIGATAYGFVVASKNDGVGFAKELNIDPNAGTILGYVAAAVSALIFGVFTFEKLNFFWNAIKEKFYGEKGIFKINHSGKLVLSAGNLGVALKEMTLSALSALGRLAIMTVAIGFLAVASIASNLLGFSIKLVRAIRCFFDPQFKENYLTHQKKDLIDNHAVHAKCRNALQATMKMTVLFVLGKCLFGNTAGQSMVNGNGAMHAISPDSSAAIVNSIFGGASAFSAGASSHALNTTGIADCTDYVFGQASFGKELPILIRHIGFSLVYLFTRHTNKATSNQKQEKQAGLASLFKLTHQELWNELDLAKKPSPSQTESVPSLPSPTTA